MGYDKEVEMIRVAHEMDLLTAPYVFNPEDSSKMASAGADIIVAHMGLTTSGMIGARTTVALDGCIRRIQDIRDAAVAVNPEVFVLCHGGPIATPSDAQYILQGVKGIHGFSFFQCT